MFQPYIIHSLTILQQCKENPPENHRPRLPSLYPGFVTHRVLIAPIKTIFITIQIFIHFDLWKICLKIKAMESSPQCPVSIQILPLCLISFCLTLFWNFLHWMQGIFVLNSVQLSNPFLLHWIWMGWDILFSLVQWSQPKALDQKRDFLTNCDMANHQSTAHCLWTRTI